MADGCVVGWLIGFCYYVAWFFACSRGGGGLYDVIVVVPSSGAACLKVPVLDGRQIVLDESVFLFVSRCSL